MTDRERTRTHDLILFAAGPYQEALPRWADRANGRAWAVVRREKPPDEGVTAAGVRGRRRAERQAIDVHGRDIIRRTAPEALVSLSLTGLASPGISRALDILSAAASSWSGCRAWGPTGSVGFQLATGLPVVHEASDLDIIVRADQYMSPAEARSIAVFLARLPCRVDCLLETGAGAVALAEWSASRGDDVLLRTSAGPRLTRNPWSRHETRREPIRK